MIDQALACLATTIFMESILEPKPTQVAVGYVLMRRADFDPKRICYEMSKPNQFSWYRKVYPPQTIDKKYYEIAYRVMHRLEYDYSYGATHFHDTSISKPKSWTRLTRVVQWSHMIFYKQEETKYAQNIRGMVGRKPQQV